MNTSALLRGERRKCLLWEDKRRWRDISKDRNNYLCIYLVIFVWQIVNFKNIFFLLILNFTPHVSVQRCYQEIIIHLFSSGFLIQWQWLEPAYMRRTNTYNLKKNDCTICKANDSKSHWCYGRCDSILVFDMCSFHSFCRESFNWIPKTSAWEKKTGCISPSTSVMQAP